MTAIMVAGRSGSAFAAQLGTMKITEEIDAMRTIGVSPIEALVIPRLIASVVMMPLLAFWAMLTALLGGGIFVWLALGIPPLTYVQRLQEVTPITDLWIGLIKAPVFGFIIALSGCFQGMLVQGMRRMSETDHHRGRPVDLPRDRARRRVRGLLQLDRVELMAEGLRSDHHHPGPAQQLRRAGRPRGPRPHRVPRRDSRCGRRLGHRQVGADAIDHRAADDPTRARSRFLART
jgi:hypothetical protein